MKKILWLASWYPNKLQPLAGDFIERHARAVSRRNSVSVIHVVKDNRSAASSGILKEQKKYNDHSNAIIIYYHAPFPEIKWLNSIFSVFIYIRLSIREVKNYIVENGKPALLHVHVAKKAGLIALWFKLFYRIPYVVTEHWTGFCAEAHPNFDDQNVLTKMIWTTIMRQSSGCTTVSDYLGRELVSKLKNLTYTVIPNVVDTDIFKPAVPGQHDIFRFIHVSTLGYQKNPEQIFEAVRILSQMTYLKFNLVIYGSVSIGLMKLSEDLGIQNNIVFKKETTQVELSKDVQRSDALLLYSRYETFGCVIIEANACGVPVVVSDLPVFKENVIEDVTGVFAPLDSPGQLAHKLLWMMENRSRFDSEQIMAITKARFSFETVSAQFDEFYKRVLGVV